MNRIYYIGGSPCAGKSTTAEILSKKYDLYYFKVDDFLDGYQEKAALKGRPICRKNTEMSSEQIWMRGPVLQCEEEFLFYQEVFEYALADLKQLPCKNGIITEGAAYVPQLMKQAGIPAGGTWQLLPQKNFRFPISRKRKFVPYVLEGCRDKEKAFENWMG